MKLENHHENQYFYDRALFLLRANVPMLTVRESRHILEKENRS